MTGSVAIAEADSKPRRRSSCQAQASSALVKAPPRWAGTTSRRSRVGALLSGSDHELEHGLDRETFGRIGEHKPARPYRLIAAPGHDVHGACVEVVLLALVGKLLRRRPGGLNHVLIAEAVHGVTVRR